MARVSVWDESVVEDIRRLGKHLNWHGALFLEYFFDEASGRVQYLEANPRIGETLNATICGVNLCEQLLRVSLDEDVEPLPQGKAGVRSHQAFMIAMAGAMNGHCRRYLLRELRRVRHREGVFENSEDELTRLRQDWPSVIPATAVIGRLLLTPRSAKKIVRQTLANYSLPDASARVIRHLKQDELTSCFT